MKDECAKPLHEKSPRGEVLSAEEQAQGESLYAPKDGTESNASGLAVGPKTPDENVGNPVGYFEVQNLQTGLEPFEALKGILKSLGPRPQFSSRKLGSA